MKTIEEVVVALNQLLTAEVLDMGLLEQSVNRFYEHCELKMEVNDASPCSEKKSLHPGIVLMDFKEHNEEKKEEARLLKVDNVIQQNFELAANMRDVEKDCATYMEFSKHYGIKKSAFILLQGFLIYTYFGNATNDAPVREFLEKGNRLKNMKIGRWISNYGEDEEEG